MKHRMRKLFVLSSALFSAFSFAQWESYYSDPELTAYYMPNKISREYGMLTVANRTDYFQAQALKGRDAPVGLYVSVIETIFIDCKKKQFAVTDITYNANKDSPPKTVHWASLSPNQFQWSSISKDSNKTRLFEKVHKACIL